MIKRRVFLLVPTFQPHDAVGNDVLGMYHILRAAGYDARIFAEFIHPAHESVTSRVEVDADALWQDRDAILIYHHAIEWKLGEEVLRRSRNRIVIKYHNVTPPDFYANYAQDCYRWCARGIEATRRLADLRIDFIWGDSQYNADEFIRLGVPASRCRVVAPIHCIEELGKVPLDAVITGVHRGATPNILFVGAFRPNKGHFKALEVFAAYLRKAGRPARLFFVGSFDPVLDQYFKEIQDYARRLEIHENLWLATSVNLSQLRSYYTVASVFLCVSEHEGFCVPLVEAMYFRVPVVAWTTTAVGETCDGCGIVRHDFDPEALAEGIEECVEDVGVARLLATRGRRRYETMFHPNAIRDRLLNLVEEVESVRGGS